MSIVVTGATGTVGRALVHQLLDAGQRVRAVTRDPDSPRARSLPSAVELVRGDLDDPASLRPALRGARAMHLVAFGGWMSSHAGDIVRIAEEAGVRRLVHLGHHDPGRDDDDPLEADHRRLHRAIERSSLEWTHVFPGEFMANTWEWAGSIRSEGVVRAPFGDWNSSMVHEADIAAVACAALLGDGHAGRAYRPTGPAPVRRRDAVRLIGEALGREVRFVELTPDQAREHWSAIYPAQVIEWFLEMGRNPDGNSWVSGDVTRVTGRPARTFARWAGDHADDFR